MGPLISSEKQLIIEMKEEGLTLAEMRERFEKLPFIK